MKLTTLSTLITFTFFSLNTYAQDNSGCGEAPVLPALVDGSTSTMEVLVENSKEVKAFIARADEYLDCSEKAYSRIAAKTQKEKLREKVKMITQQRNDIGDRFNEQVAAYRAANPK